MVRELSEEQERRETEDDDPKVTTRTLCHRLELVHLGPRFSQLGNTESIVTCTLMLLGGGAEG